MSRVLVLIASLLLLASSADTNSAAAPVLLGDTDESSGSVELGFQFASDGSRVVYKRRVQQGLSEVFKLYSVASTGGVPIALSSDIYGSSITYPWRLSNNGDRVAFWADHDSQGVRDVYVVPTQGGSALKVSESLVDQGSIGGGFAGVNGDRVIYVASQISGPFTGPVYELFSSPSSGGEATKLNGSLVNGGDVQGVVLRADGGRVLYFADQDQDDVVELYSVSPLGGLPIKLNGALATDRDVLSEGLQFSPNGNFVLYLADQQANDLVELYSVPATGGTPVRLNATLPNGGDVTASSVRYSPDGMRVVYHADQNANDVFEIFSVPSSGGTPIRLNGPLAAGGDVESTGLQISPDSSRVLYRADQNVDGVTELFSVPSGGGTPVRLNGPLPAGGNVSSDPTFSPNSGLVLYRADQFSDDVFELFSVASIGGTPVRLNGELVLGGDVVRAAFSPDGSRVVYLADQESDDVFELFAVPSLGTGKSLCWSMFYS